MDKLDVQKLINIHGCLTFRGSWDDLCHLHGRIIAIEDDKIKFKDGSDRYLKFSIKDVEFEPINLKDDDN